MPINIVSTGCVEMFERGGAGLFPMHRMARLAELPAILSSLETSSAGQTCDLIGHSGRTSKLLILGDTAIDLFDAKVRRCFQMLATSGICARLGITAIRLLGCETATRSAGQYAIRTLAKMLDLRVHGTLVRLRNAHYDHAGFKSSFVHVLVDDHHLTAPYVSVSNLLPDRFERFSSTGFAAPAM